VADTGWSLVACSPALSLVVLCAALLLLSEDSCALLPHSPLLRRPLLLPGPQPLHSPALLDLLLLDALSFEQGLLARLVEGEGAVGREAVVKVLVADLCDAGVVVAGDLDALESEEEDAGEMHVVVCVGDVDLVLEGLWRGGRLVVVVVGGRGGRGRRRRRRRRGGARGGRGGGMHCGLAGKCGLGDLA
jgi:hypothetical protein